MARSVADLVASAAADDGDRAAIVDPDGTVLPWGEIEQRVARLASGLAERGVMPGDRVGVKLPNGSGFAVAAWAVLRAGATLVPINPEYTPPERDYIVHDSGARWLFTTADDLHLPDGVTPLDADADAAGAGGQGAAEDGTDCAVICYTSGTTGHPKGARLTHDNLLANLTSFSDLPSLQLHADDCLLGILPFFHIFGLNVVLNAAARERATVVALDRFSPRAAVDAMNRHGVTVAYGAPPVFAALTAVDRDLPALRAAVSGADALPVPTWERFAERFGIEILEGYGLTETAPVLASNAAAATCKPGTVGVPLPGVDIELRDPAGQAAPAGKVGEIHARGPNVFSGYHGQPAASAKVLRDGWFATGDLGAFDADGYLSIVGRVKEMIIVSGFNVYPREIENALLEHPGVAEAAVLGVPDRRTGERVRAVIVAAPGHAGLTTDDVVAHCRTRLARYKLPREVVFVAALPRLPSGKVARRLLPA